MKEGFKLVAVLALFCLVAGALLAGTYRVTKAPIEKAKQAELVDSLKRVLPECDNDVVAEAKTIGGNGLERTFYVARKAGAVVGVAFLGESDKGYGGPVKVVVSLNGDDTIRTVLMLAYEKETPGLGTKIAERKFTAQFEGRAAGAGDWVKVQKDGGEVVAVTGATISSRAASDAIRTGLELYAAHRAEIVGGEGAP